LLKRSADMKMYQVTIRLTEEQYDRWIELKDLQAAADESGWSSRRGEAQEELAKFWWLQCYHLRPEDFIMTDDGS
jgi:hypothetical protein